MAEQLFRVNAGLSDNNISYLSGAVLPGGDTGVQDAAGIGSQYSNITNGDKYRKIAAGAGTTAWEKIPDTADISTAVSTAVSTSQTTLQTSIDANAAGLAQEITDRTAADAALQTSITANTNAIAQEVTDRTAADTALQANIDTKLSKAGDSMTGNLVMTSGTHIALPDAPVNATDAANKAYVDASVAGLTWKNAVRAMSSTNVALTGAQTVDGVALVAGDRILVAGQTNSADNGIYVVGAAAWSRAADMDASTPLNEFNSAAVFVEEGTTYADTGWTQINTVSTVGTDLVAFTQFNGAAGITAGIGLNKVGNTLDVNMGAGIGVLPTDEVGVDLRASSGLFLTEDGSTVSGGTAAQLAIQLSDTSLTAGPSGLQLSAALQTEIATATSGVASNLAAITTNTSDIAANTAAIAALGTGNVASTQGELDATQAGAGLDLNGNYITVTGSNYIDTSTSIVTAVSLLDSAVKANLDAQAAINTAQTTTNNSLSASITANTASINTNATDIATNAAGIAANVASITTNATNIATNTAAIAANATDITTNATDIATNSSSIVAIQTAQGVQDGLIAGNTTAINTNASDITALTATVGTNTTNIATNASDIAALQASLDSAVATGTTAVTGSGVADSVSTTTSIAAKWLVTFTDTANGRREAVEVYGMHNGIAGDATEVDWTEYSKLKFGAPIQGSDISVTLTGTGAGQTMNLIASATGSVTVTTTRLTA